MNLASRTIALQPTAVNRVLHEVRELQQQKRPVYSLMRGQPDFATPPHILQAAREALEKGRTSYADNRGEPALRQAIATKLQRDSDLAYDWEREILVTDGATGGLSTALAVILEPGDEVLVPDPIYDAYAGPIALWGGKSVAVPSLLQAGRFTLDPGAFERACTPRTKLLLLNTPWNPTGTVLTHAELVALMEFACRKNLWVLSDEIYEAMIFDGHKHLSPAQLSAEARERTIVVNSLSKTYAMTGWRCGYCAAPRRVIDAMFLVWQQSSRGPATFVQDAATAALLGDQGCVGAMTLELERRRNRVLDVLANLPGVVAPRPEGGLFVMLDVRSLGRPSDEIRRHLLEKAGVVVIHGAAYGQAAEGTLRVSFAAGGPALDEALTHLRNSLASLL